MPVVSSDAPQQPNTPLKSAGTDIATKNFQEKHGSKRNHKKAAFFATERKKTQPSEGYTLFPKCNSVKFQKENQSFPEAESTCLKSKFINTDGFTLTACPETPLITSYIS